jgi:hypothetical protein
MKLNFIKPLSLCIASSLFCASFAQDDSRRGCQKIVKYVKGGACTPGEGTKSHPFGTLQEAEENSWDVLIVLSSTVALDGGITLKSGQKLIGEEDPTCLALSPTQPTITNSSNTKNGGNGAVIVGQGTIENIYFKNTFASGIIYDEGTNVSIKNVLVTGHNVGGLSFKEAIGGMVTRSGKTYIRNTVIRNSAHIVTSDRGIAEFATQNARRDIHISSCEITDVPAENTTALIVSAGGAGNVTAIIEHTYIHDIVGRGIHGQTLQTGSGNLTLCVKKTVLNNIGDIHLLNFALSGTITSQICACTFQQPVIALRSAVFLYSSNSTINSTIENCSSDNLSSFVATQHSDTSIGSTQKVRILNNTIFERIQEGGHLYRVLNNSSLVPNAQTTETYFEGNLFTGNNGILIFPNSPWLLLDIKLTHNCLNGFGSEPFALFAASGDAGPQATITACKNNIVGFSPQIVDFGTTSAINYIVPKNWWGGGMGLCGDNADCTQYQTCSFGHCFGPDTVLTRPDYTGRIDTSNPLIAPIKCPRSCCPLESITPPFLQRKGAAQETQMNTQEKLESLQSQHVV